ncbi:uncharacterized protein LOC111308804 [Durio zibethinus]|uniref:Uncharacterized protein LOC111308804 n=1 Tax=Durio zibethinus TaxID=66656 RepID=A0A6P6AE43_DURZI|nr:uncharacterized protein LOC111308804 [Durio zibethinus]
MHANMIQEAGPHTQRSTWITNINHFFHLPNRKIYTLFIISSTATFSLGIAMIVQWVLYGQYHLEGFHWMVYSASAITSLPILIWIIFLLFAIRFHASPSSNLPKPQAHQQTDTEAAAAQDDLAMVQTEILNDHPSGLNEEQPACESLIPVSQPGDNIDNKQALKRTLSLPLSHVPADYSNFKRSTSLKQ